MVFFFTLLDSNEYQTLEFLMFHHQEHVWFIDCVFYTPCPTCAFLMLCTQPSLVCTFATLVMPRSISFFFILCMSYLFYALQHFVFIEFCFLFEFYFLIHLVPLMYLYPCSYFLFFSFLFFPSFLLIHLSICDKKRESILDSILECIVISI